MRFNFNSLIFKSLSIIFISFVVVTIFLIFSAKQTFQQGYLNIINEKISMIEKHISPSIALNLSYGFDKAIEELASTTLNNPDVLLIKIESSQLKSTLIDSKNNKQIPYFIQEKEFISDYSLIDPATNKEIGKLTLVYSKKSYEEYMNDFYTWLTSGLILLGISLLFLLFYFYNALKQLGILEEYLKKFNPSKPSYIPLDSNSKDEIASITASTNIMIENIIKYINYSKELNQNISEQQKHLKDAQRIANVGSWEYDLITKELKLSDEMYRILSISKDSSLSWEDFLAYISDKDTINITTILNNAMDNGSIFDIKYIINLNNQKSVNIHTVGKVRKKADGTKKITSVSRDITKDVKNEQMIEKLAYYDALTQLPNRSLLKNRIHKALEVANREKGKVALIFLDLDHFKLINDTLGHSVGDSLLIYVAKTLKKQLRDADTLARLGGDEFVILIPNIKNTQDIELIASKLLNSLRGKHDVNSHQLYITTSIGISIYPDNSQDMDEMITNADTAMYDAKQDGRNNYKFYSKDMGNHISRQMMIEQDLRVALQNQNELELYYQAKIDSHTDAISGVEVLIRWNHPKNGLMFPDEFIETAESTGMILDMGNWIIEQSILQVKEWNKQGIDKLVVAINLSPRQFQDKELTKYISSLIQKYQINPAQLEFEITETMSMTTTEATLRILSELKEIGVSIAIDDFGTGYSSLSYLKKFPIDILKIDRSFIMDMIDNEEDMIITETIISMAHTLGLETVAEGVETQEHVDILKKIGCDQLQGYHYSRPIPVDQFTKLLNNI